MKKEIENLYVYGNLYRKLLNLPHRRLIVDDSFRVCPYPQKKLYSSCGCLLLKCPFVDSYCVTCNNCDHSYNIMDL